MLRANRVWFAGRQCVSVRGNGTRSHGGIAALGVRTVEVPRHNTCLEHFPDTSTLGAQHAPTRWALREGESRTEREMKWEGE